MQCIWKDNRELLGCKSANVYNKIRKLCSSPITIGTIIYDKNYLYVFTHLNVYVFDPRGKLNQNMDPKFTKLVSDNIRPSERWPGFDPNYGRFFAKDNHLCVIIENIKYSCWTPDGHQIVKERPIGEPDYEIPDQLEDNSGDAAALINPEDNGGKYSRIRANKVCDLIIENEEMFFIGQCSDVSSDSRQFPPNIIAAIKPKDNNWYFFNKNAKYCKRPQNSVSKV